MAQGRGWRRGRNFTVTIREGPHDLHLCDLLGWGGSCGLCEGPQGVV